MRSMTACNYSKIACFNDTSKRSSDKKEDDIRTTVFSSFTPFQDHGLDWNMTILESNVIFQAIFIRSPYLHQLLTHFSLSRRRFNKITNSLTSQGCCNQDSVQNGLHLLTLGFAATETSEVGNRQDRMGPASRDETSFNHLFLDIAL